MLKTKNKTEAHWIKWARKWKGDFLQQFSVSFVCRFGKWHLCCFSRTCSRFQLEVVAGRVYWEFCNEDAMIQHGARDSNASLSQPFVSQGARTYSSQIVVMKVSGGERAYREVSVEVVFPIKKWLLVDGAVESQSCHHYCLHTSFVQDLWAHKEFYPGGDMVQKQHAIWIGTLTGNVPGKEASKNDTREFGGAEKRTDEPENSLVLELICAWISKPTTPTSCWGALQQREVEHIGRTM